MKPAATLISCVVLGFCSAAAAQVIAIQGAKVVSLSSAGTLDNATVLIENGRIVNLGAALAVPAGAQVIDARGQWITPGLFAPLTTLGLVDIKLDESTRDYRVSGAGFDAAFDVQYAINPRSSAIATARSEGVTHAAVTPLAGSSVFAGLGALIELSDADRIVTRSKAFAFAALGAEGRDKAGGSRSAAMMRLQFGLDAAAQLEAGKQEPGMTSQLDAEALRSVVNGKIPLVIGVDRASDITEVIAMTARYSKLNVVLLGAAEGWLVADALAKARIAVILNPYTNLPLSFDDLAATRHNAERLNKAGVLVSFTTGAEEYHPPLATLTQAAGNAVANGLPWLESLKAITLNPAKIFHVEDQLGSLEVGRAANLVVWDGDPLEVMTSPVHVFVAGQELSLKTRQILLRDRYRNPTERRFPTYH